MWKEPLPGTFSLRPSFIREEESREESSSTASEYAVAAEGEEAPPFQPPEDDQNQNPEKKKKKGKIITLICVLALVVIGAGIGIFFALQGGGSSLTPLQEALQLGEKYLNELDYENAVMAFTEATEIDPKSTKAYMGLRSVLYGYSGLRTGRGLLPAAFGAGFF